MRILLLTQYFPPEPAPGAMRFCELAEFLVQRGHDVTVVTGFPNYPHGIVHQRYQGKLFLKENIDEVQVTRVPLYTSPTKKSLHRTLNYLSFALTCIIGMLASRKQDIVYVLSPPFFLGLSACFVKRVRNVPFVFEVQDLWPQAPIQRGYVRNQAIANILLKAEKYIYSQASKVFAISPIMKEQIVRKGVTPEKILVNYNWVDTDLFAPSDEGGKLRLYYALEGKFVVTFAGNMGIAQGLDNLIKAANELRHKDDIVFLFVGDGIEKPKLEDMVKHYQLNNVIFIPQQPFHMMPAFFSMADILILHLNKARFRKAAVPSKLQGYMSCAKPVLVAAEGAASHIVEEAQCGLIAEPENATSIAQGVYSLYSNRHQLRDFGVNARRYAETHFDKQKIEGKIERMLLEIAESHVMITNA